MTKAMAVKGKMNVRSKIVINSNIMEQLNSFNYVRYTITVSNSRDLEIKMNRFNQMCSTIHRTLNIKARKERQIKFYKAVTVTTLTHGLKKKKRKQTFKLQK
jgi:hypothetical protein